MQPCMALAVRHLKQKLDEFQPVEEFMHGDMFPMSFGVGSCDVAVSAGRVDAQQSCSRLWNFIACATRSSA